MNLSEAKIYVRRCKESFEKFKARFSREERKVLDGAKLVVCVGCEQIELNELYPKELGMNHQKCLAHSSTKKWLMHLVNQQACIENQIEQLNKDLSYVKRQIYHVSEHRLELHPFTAQLRFETLDFALIDKLKNSEISDKQHTNMSRASIRIILTPLKED